MIKDVTENSIVWFKNVSEGASSGVLRVPNKIDEYYSVIRDDGRIFLLKPDELYYSMEECLNDGKRDNESC